MNKLGVHVLVWVGQYDEASLRRAVEWTAEAGFGLLEMSLHEPVDTVLLRKLADEHDLELSCSRGFPFDADISNEDEAIAERGYQMLKSTLDVTRELGASYMGGILYSAFGKYDRPPTPAGHRNSVAYLQRLAKEAERDGIRLGLEVVNRYESNALNTAAQALSLMDEVGADNVVLHLDTYHMNIEETDFESPVRQAGDRLGYVHVGESNRGYLGHGTIDFAQFFAALKGVGYTGPITFESFSSAVVSPGLSNTLAVWRNLWDDGMDLAKQARRFVAEGMGIAEA